MSKYGKEHHLSKAIIQYDVNNNLIREWDCITDADKYFNGNGNISKCLNNKTKTAYGFVWRYKYE